MRGGEEVRSRRGARFIRLAVAAIALVSIQGSVPGDTGIPWGRQGHTMAARAAVAALPGDTPDFFRDAGEQLAYLAFEPDRWKVREFVELDRAGTYDHYVDLENLPPGAIRAPDRFTYLDALHAAGLREPERDGGFLHLRIVELYQRLVTEWRFWHAESDPVRRSWIEARIINDAGILGHYVTDGSQPHHTTIHFNGWASGAPNPNGYPADRTFHSRFETGFVGEHVQQADVSARVRGPLRAIDGSVRDAVIQFILASHERVDELYRLDRDVGFDPRSPAQPAARAFAADRLADGSIMLARLWVSAWREGTKP